MVRVSAATASRKRKKRVLKAAKGQFGQRSTRYQQAKRSIVKGLTYAYRDRKVKKREIRSLWIIRINAACQENGITYSRFINGLKKANVEMDRKVLAEVAVTSPSGFKKLVKLAKDPKTNAKKETKAAKKEPAAATK